MTEQHYAHWKLNTDSHNILWLTLDREGAPVNSLSREVFDELDSILDMINHHKPAGVIIKSGKTKGFIAGADISQFTHLETSDQAYDLIRQAQIILNKLEKLDVPTVAMINGFCLGGGTELSLACDYRIACDVAATKIGLPEVKLGIHPGWGGTVRAPLLIGVPNAMQMMLTGSPLSARKAKRVGLVDEAVPLRELERAAVHYILKRPKKHKPGLMANIMNLPLVRPMVGRKLMAMLAKKNVIKEHYPAPYAMVHNWVRDGCHGNAMVNEAKSIAELMVGDTARNLVRIFFLQTAMKNAAKGSSFNPRHVHVIGAGTMGGDMAAWFAYKGFHVTLQDQTPEKIAPAISRAYKLYKKKLKKPRLIQAVMDHLQPDEKGYGVATADLVIEAVFEDLEVKHALMKSIEPKLKSEAIIATNTSSLALSDIARALQHPERLVGIHFFNPVAKMPLVEVVRGKQTDEQIVKDAARFVTKISRSPLVVKDSPGFLINRILMPYLMEAMLLFEEGVAIETIDRVAVNFGMPMGPITLADTVGLDICLHAAESLTKVLGGSVPLKLKQMVDDGKLGIKSGHGFYQYTKGDKVRSSAAGTDMSKEDICDRLVLSMVNEAVMCLHEGIVEEADSLDIGMIFGTGFAPFRGGPIHYAKHRGIEQILQRLDTLESQYGERFKPRPGWEMLSDIKEKVSAEASVEIEKIAGSQANE
ncbi:MAG: enoyl-CoA hydratase/isomerase family protein [Gammaproteobacteria bacterium]|nr:enoyl-CoA hydratase/isomerase family protein [Gammaproteobacteria bacterium]